MGQGDKEKEGEKEGEEVRDGEGCLHYLQVSSHVARRLTDLCCLAMNLPALCCAARPLACPFIYSTRPFRTCMSTLHSGWGSVQQSPYHCMIFTRRLVNPLGTNKMLLHLFNLNFKTCLHSSHICSRII